MTKPPDEEKRLHEALSRFSQPTRQPDRCRYCGNPVRAQGRRVKRFCRALCRTRFHYRKKLARQAELRRRLEEAGVAVEAATAAAGSGSEDAHRDEESPK